MSPHGREGACAGGGAVPQHQYRNQTACLIWTRMVFCWWTSSHELASHGQAITNIMFEHKVVHRGWLLVAILLHSRGRRHLCPSMRCVCVWQQETIEAPVERLCTLRGHESLLYSLYKYLSQPICCWVIWRRLDLLNTVHFHECLLNSSDN